MKKAFSPRSILWPVLLLALAVTVFAIPAFAATDVTGSWTAALQTPDGNTIDLTYTLKQDGAKITGTVQGPQGPLDLLNGRIDGAKVHWEIKFDGATLAEDGTLSDDGAQIKLSIQSSDGAFPRMDITLSRASGVPVAAAASPAPAATPALAATPSAPGDATGTWSGQMQGPDGDMTLTFHFKQDGAALTGTVDSPMGGEPMPIQNGKIDGDKVHWETSFNGMTINHDGTISGDQMKITIKPSDNSFPAMEITLRRSK